MEDLLVTDLLAVHHLHLVFLILAEDGELEVIKLQPDLVDLAVVVVMDQQHLAEVVEQLDKETLEVLVITPEMLWVAEAEVNLHLVHLVHQEEETLVEVMEHNGPVVQIVIIMPVVAEAEELVLKEALAVQAEGVVVHPKMGEEAPEEVLQLTLVQVDPEVEEHLAELVDKIPEAVEGAEPIQVDPEHREDLALSSSNTNFNRRLN